MSIGFDKRDYKFPQDDDVQDLIDENGESVRSPSPERNKIDAMDVTMNIARELKGIANELSIEICNEMNVLTLFNFLSKHCKNFS
jgi:hypothetical protein